MILALAASALAGQADVGGYFRVAARPDLQGGNGRLGYWNLYGRLMNEGSYGMLELRYDVLPREPGTETPWSAVHVRVEGGSIGQADAGNGSLANFRMSQMYVRSGNVLLKDVTWQVGTLEYFFGDLGLYDMRPATILGQAVGASATFDSGPVELLVGVGDSGWAMYQWRYNAVPTGAAALRLRLAEGKLEVGGATEVRYESGVPGNVNAPYQTPGITYEDWIRGEVGETWIAEHGEEQADYFPDPVSRDASSFVGIGYLGFGGLGPLRWNNLFLRYERLHPQRSTTEDLLGQPLELWISDFTDQRTALTIGDEMQLGLVPKRLDAVIAGLWGDQRDLDNQIAPSDFDRTFGSTVQRLQLYATPTVHLLVESAVAREWSRNGNRFREHADSVFTNTAGQPDTRGLELGDSDTRSTWQGKGGVVLSPLGPGVFVRPSLRLLYGVQYSSQNNAFGNAFVESVDQWNAFGNVEQHWHHLGAIEAEAWF